MKFCWAVTFLCSQMFSISTTVSIGGPLHDYVKRPEPKFSWKQTSGQIDHNLGTIYSLRLTSQEWKGIVWQHNLQVFVPAELIYPSTMLLVVSGGSNSSQPDKEDMELGLKLANLSGSACAVLSQVPNQPLYDGKGEDDLIAHTFEKYLELEDATWLLLLPMVNSAIKAMDALQTFINQTLQVTIKDFVIMGASKRGWTSWLTAAVDSRIKATMPIVIDTLNMPDQMKYQLEVWGSYSEEIGDYTVRGIQDHLGTEMGQNLVSIVDPYSYREQLTMPKLSVIGTNDNYWVLDAMNLYWDGLPDPKYVLYVPNSGHNLEDRERAISGLTGFYRFVASDRDLPNITWKHSQENDRLQLHYKSDQKPVEARLWVAASINRDFRNATWLSVPAKLLDNGAFVGELILSPTHYVAILGELIFMIDGQPCPLSTQVSIGTPLVQQ
ncbi:TPA: phenylacetic acid degradation protein [Candidatus Poribacteria bacterium]|nr:phenylacetic acid degradation protein [Candidatus Poribacteria bacterium]HIN29727.1 phenylacetic acid degradation protein [Candidatus Poribacteria bacterium]HIO82189.1 phenylacetic acid degradation protein [Candidatus Poribacteria bacterium]